MTRTTEGSGWVALPSPKPWGVSYLLLPMLFPLIGSVSFNLTLTFVRHLPLGWIIVIMAVVLAVVVTLVLLIIRAVYPRPRLNPLTATIRAGRRETRYSDLTTAQLLVTFTRKQRILNLLLRARTGMPILICVRDGHGRTLDPETALLVQEMIEQSSITIPVSSDDPTGKFARYNFPDHLTKEDAIDLVAHPPELGDELPIPPRI